MYCPILPHFAAKLPEEVCSSRGVVPSIKKRIIKSIKERIRELSTAHEKSMVARVLEVSLMKKGPLNYVSRSHELCFTARSTMFLGP